LQILGRVRQERLLGGVTAEAIDLAVLVGPGALAVGRDMLALGQAFRALAAELCLRRRRGVGCVCAVERGRRRGGGGAEKG